MPLQNNERTRGELVVFGLYGAETDTCMSHPPSEMAAGMLLPGELFVQPITFGAISAKIRWCGEVGTGMVDAGGRQ